LTANWARANRAVLETAIIDFPLYPGKRRIRLQVFLVAAFQTVAPTAWKPVIRIGQN